MSYMLILSRIKSFLSNLFIYKNNSNSLSKGEVTEALGIDKNKLNIKSTKEGIVININGISITITEEKDLTIKGIRFLDINSELLFLNSEEKGSTKLKELYLKDELVETFNANQKSKTITPYFDKHNLIP